MRKLQLGIRGRNNDPQAPLVVELNGGLGNQLFQYGAALSQAKRLEVGLQIDTSLVDKEGARGFELGEFAQGIIASPKTSTSKYKFTEKSFAYDSSIEQISPSTSLHGYFQSWMYVDSVREILLNSLNPKIVEPETSEENFIALQVRRGDYTNPDQLKFHGICSLSYYKNGLNLIREIVGDIPAIVFCDDQKVGQEFSKELPNCIADEPGSETPLQTLRRLTKAKAHVIANSSFGWWGSWLSNTSEVTVAPRPWFGDKRIDTSDLLPPEWLTLDRR